MVDSPVLVLNQNYEPLNIARARRAVVLLLRGKAEALENGAGVIHTPTQAIEVPSVIRLAYLVRCPHTEKRLTRVEVFRRDGYTCQYCGQQTPRLTVDHVIPRRRNGGHVWENVVSACHTCNGRKAGRTPQEAGMVLIRQPRAPRMTGYYVPYEYIERHTEWRKFFPMWRRAEDEA